MEELPLEGVVKNILVKWNKERKEKGEDLLGAWGKAAGSKAFKRSKPVRVEKGRLNVNVTDSSWLYELTLRKKEILEKLNRILKSKKIKEIRFRIGETEKGE